MKRAEEPRGSTAAAPAVGRDTLIVTGIASSILIGLAVSTVILWNVGIGGVLETLRHAGWAVILAYLTVSVLISVVLTFKWRVVLDAYGVRLPFYTIFIYRLIGFAVSYVTPTAHVGGEPVRAMLLNKQGIPMKVGFSSAIVDRSLEVIFNILMFFLGALIILNFVGFPLGARIAIFALSLVAITVVGLFIWGVLSKKRFISSTLKLFRVDRRKSWPAIENWAREIEILIGYFYAKKRRHFRIAVMLNALLWVLMMLEYKFALLILGYDTSVFGAFLFLTGVAIAYSIPIPAGFGVLEIGQVSAGALLGIPAAVGVAMAFIIRARDFLWTVIGLLLLAAFHYNVLHLFERSQAMARKYNFETIRFELADELGGRG